MSQYEFYDLDPEQMYFYFHLLSFKTQINGTSRSIAEYNRLVETSRPLYD